MKLKSCPADDFKRDSDDVISGICVEHSMRSHVTPEKLIATSTTTGFDLDDRLSGDETNSSLRAPV